ncbi:hotdog fold thioesterase [Pseudokineococcus basanitobsidens]|uniref:hotdog fold thioesterase n=1 Tax=Pseudokineococcus basanitobsidens TaxID=1926649 RepID=UPI003BB5F89D
MRALAAEDPAAAARAATAVCAGTLAERTGTEFVSVAPDQVVARMPVAGNTQPAGLLHGGASAALAETVGSVGATLAAGPGVVAVGVDLNATHHRALTPARSAWVVATGRPLHVGRRVVSYEVVVTDDQGRRVCTARLTCQLLAARGG